MVDKKGRLLVSDFGLAKSLELQDAEFPEGIIGTPAYMSPEQAEGAESDQRSDIYSLGVILYEMFSGRRPFEADTRAEYLKKHIHEIPKPPTAINPDLPEFLQNIILQCLEKDPQNRYASVNEILIELENRGAPPISEKAVKARRRAVGIVAFFALIIGAAVGYYWFWGRGDMQARSLPPPVGISIAIMEFSNGSGDQTLDSMRGALQNYLFWDLYQSKYLRIFPESRLQQVLEELGVVGADEYSGDLLNRIAEATEIQYFILGSIGKREDEIWITASVRKAGSDEVLETAEASGRSEDDLDKMVDDLTSQLIKAFELTEAQILADINGSVGNIFTPSEEAAELYTAGRKFYQERRNQQSVDALEEAVKIDPEFAMAYLLLSEVYGDMGDQEKSENNLLKANEYTNRVSERDRLVIQAYLAMSLENSYIKSTELFQELVDLYPDDPDAHGYLAWMYRVTENWEKAQYHYEFYARSQDLIHRAFAIDCLAWVYAVQGRYEDAINTLKDNHELFDNKAWLHRYCSNYNMCLRDYDAALVEAKEALRIDQEDLETHRLLGNVYLFQEKYEDAKAAYQVLIDGDDTEQELWGIYWLANLHLTRGQYQECRRICYEGIAKSKEYELMEPEAEFWLLLCHLENQRRDFERVDDVSTTLLEVSQNMGEPGFQMTAILWRGIARLMNKRVDETKTLADELKVVIDSMGVEKLIRYHKHLLGWIELEQDNPAGAIGHFDAAVIMLPQQNYVFDNHALFRNSLACALVKNREYDKAFKEYERVSQLSTGRLNWGDIYGLSFYELGKIAQMMDRRDAAIENYRQFLSLWSEADADLESVKDAKEQLAKLESS
jgi:tetratricopeptide (TPR) repeat protein